MTLIRRAEAKLVNLENMMDSDTTSSVAHMRNMARRIAYARNELLIARVQLLPKVLSDIIAKKYVHNIAREAVAQYNADMIADRAIDELAD